MNFYPVAVFVASHFELLIFSTNKIETMRKVTRKKNRQTAEGKKKRVALQMNAIERVHIAAITIPKSFQFNFGF